MMNHLSRNFSKLLLIFNILFISNNLSFKVHKANANTLDAYTRTNKPEFAFNLEKIQRATREGVKQADEVIYKLEKAGNLEILAQKYFQKYLEGIASYNNNFPQTENLVESYRTQIVISSVLKSFKTLYPEYTYDQSDWMFNSVGGVYANTIVLYCSPKEYVVIWGTSLESHGKFSGYYPFMDEFDIMMRGKMLSHNLDSSGHAPVIYKPIVENGDFTNTVDTSNLINGNVRSYTLYPHTYMVSYAQGNMLKALGVGAIMPGVFVNQDFGGLYAHLAECAKSYKESDPNWMKPIVKIKNIFNELKARLGFPGKEMSAKKHNHYLALEMALDSLK